MNPGNLVNGVLRSVMGGRGKPSRKALNYLTGRRNSSFLSNPATLLTAAGVAWGIYETLQGGREVPGAGAPQGPTGVPPVAAAHPPVPGAPPPLPATGAASASQTDHAIRLVRLAVSAALADGTLNERERAAILERASETGVADVIERELQRPAPLASIVSGVTDPGERATLYVLAYTILRADEQVSGAERIYLAQLAHLLGLDPPTVQQLETDTGERIEALGDQGQLGG